MQAPGIVTADQDDHEVDECGWCSTNVSRQHGPGHRCGGHTTSARRASPFIPNWCLPDRTVPWSGAFRLWPRRDDGATVDMQPGQQRSGACHEIEEGESRWLGRQIR